MSEASCKPHTKPPPPPPTHTHTEMKKQSSLSAQSSIATKAPQVWHMPHHDASRYKLAGHGIPEALASSLPIYVVHLTILFDQT